jgi:NAD(P)H-nitrite reductase large subunit
MYDIVIVGGGAAGFSAAEAARHHSSDARILLIQSEAVLPYDRTRLSKELVAGVSSEKLLLAHESWYEEQEIDLMLDTEVSEIDRSSHVVRVDGDDGDGGDDIGEQLEYRKLVLATGAKPLFPPVVRPHKEDSFYVVRDIDDAQRLMESAKKSKDILISGMGVLSVELAWQFRELGKRVAMVGATPQIMPRQLNARAGELIEDRLAKNKIKLLFQEEILSFEQNNKGAMEVQMIKHSGTYDMVVFCIGVDSRTALAEQAELDVDRGVRVDEHLVTSDPDIYAAGDVAEHPGGSMTHVWEAAAHQGRIAGINAAGGDVVFEQPAFAVETEVFGSHFLSINKPQNPLGYVIDETEEEDTYVCFYYRENALSGVIAVNDGERRAAYEEAVRNSWSRDDVESQFLPVV